MNLTLFIKNNNILHLSIWKHFVLYFEYKIVKK